MRLRPLLFSVVALLATPAFFSVTSSAATSPIAAGPTATTLPPAVAASKRIVILGDSITYAGGYVDFVEAVIRTRLPDWHGEIIDVGLSSETVSGLSEDGHAGGKFPRPDLHERLERVLTQMKPDLVLACYGMNDGIYYPFAEERFTKFREGMIRLHDAVTAAHAAIIHITPPIFDPQPISTKVLPAGRVSYPQPYDGYNDVLDRYSAWLISQRAQGWDIIDAHTPMAVTLSEMRKKNPTFTFSKDGVHPDIFGHSVIARAILTAWGLRPNDGDLLTKLTADSDEGLVKLIRDRRKLLENAWLSTAGHKRPGVTPGLPLAEAEAKAAALEERIRALK